MCFPEFAAGKSGDVSEVIGIRDDLPDERCCAVLDSLQAPFLVEGKEGRNKAGSSRFEDMIRISKDRPDMLSTGSLLGKSQTRKILFIKAYEDRAQDSRQRQVLQRIVDDLEERKERLDFRILDVIVFSAPWQEKPPSF